MHLTLDENAIHIGGVKVTNDPRFIDYDHFDGCISSQYTQHLAECSTY